MNHSTTRRSYGEGQGKTEAPKKGTVEKGPPGRWVPPLFGGMRHHPLTQVNAFPEILGKLMW